MGEKAKYLSASRIKTLKSCSWLYYANYILKLPDKSNSGAQRGTICHLVLECLLNKRHKKHIAKIRKAGTIDKIPSIARLVKKHLKKDGLLDDAEEDHYRLCDEMILVGLNHDFLGARGSDPIPEQDFRIDNERYKIRGFIDKSVFYKGGKVLDITDYKTSKRKFEGDDLNDNIQAKSYAIAAKAIWPQVEKVKVKFLFLRFPDDPEIEIEPSLEELDNFEDQLEKYYKQINNFSEQDAYSNLAATKPYPKKDEGFCGPLMCGYGKYPGHKNKLGKVYWVCPAKWPFDYYGIKNSSGEIVETAFEPEGLRKLEKGEKAVILHYNGCPIYRKKKEVDILEDF